MTDKEVMQMALETLEQITPDWRTSIDKSKQLNNSIETLRTALAQPEPEHDLEDVRCEGCGYMTYHREHMGCIRAAAQPESKPAAWLDPWAQKSVTLDYEAYGVKGIPLYIAPPQREWVGLTDDEYELMAEKRVTNYFFNTLDYAHDIEAKLKEKNT